MLIKKTVKSSRVGLPRQGQKRKPVSAAAAKRKVTGKKKRRAR